MGLETRDLRRDRTRKGTFKHTFDEESDRRKPAEADHLRGNPRGDISARMPSMSRASIRFPPLVQDRRCTRARRQ